MGQSMKHRRFGRHVTFQRYGRWQQSAHPSVRPNIAFDSRTGGGLRLDPVEESVCVCVSSGHVKLVLSSGHLPASSQVYIDDDSNLLDVRCKAICVTACGKCVEVNVPICGQSIMIVACIFGHSFVHLLNSS